MTVGSATQGFRRLLDGVESLVVNGMFGGEAVFIQAGNNPGFAPAGCDVRPFLAEEEFERALEVASLIICHGGTTQLRAIWMGKTPVVMPRRRKYAEVVNDHQLQLVEMLARDGLVVPAYEPEHLASAVEEVRSRPPRSVPRSPMASLVARAIEELTHRW